MDAVKKTKLEKNIVLLLLAVFTFIFLGTLKSLGMLGRKAPPQTNLAIAPLSEPQMSVPESIQQFRKRISTTAQPEISQPTQEPVPQGEVVQYTASTVRDPLASLLPGESQDDVEPVTIPELPALPAAEPPTVSIQGMIWDSPRPQALIDGEVYEVGDAVEGATIVAIDREGITVDVEGSTFRLTPTRVTDFGPQGASSSY